MRGNLQKNVRLCCLDSLAQIILLLGSFHGISFLEDLHTDIHGIPTHPDDVLEASRYSPKPY